MAQYTPRTISALISDVEKGKIILPAMQRNFVWEEEKICKLFDSLIHDYPIGTFLFWQIDSDTFGKYTFKKFVRDYNEEDRGFNRGEDADAQLSEYFAVLDGQQRITSLYLGLRGYWRTHKKYTDWSKPASYYLRYLCINVIQKRDLDDEAYEFCFINESDIEKDNGDGKFWIKVGDIFDEKQIKPDEKMDTVSENFPTIFDTTRNNKARQMLRKLNTALAIATNIHYYAAENMTLSEVGEIFVRVNNGGQKLSYSDLMLSVATGDLNGIDVHDAIEEKIQYINSKADEEKGFKVDTELILTAGLMFTNAESLSLKSPQNYQSDRMKLIFEDQWDNISEALAVAVEYIEYLGFIGKKLTSKNLILPIAYYFYANSLSITKEKGASARACCDFIFIRQWLLRSMINSVFSDNIGSTLLRIRGHISSNNKYFPLDVLMKEEVKKGKGLDVTKEQIEEDILEYKKGDSRVIPILMEIAGDTTARTYDADHIWPQSSLNTNKAIRKNYTTASDDEIKQFKYYCDRLPNIEILDPGVNKSKNDTLYEEWIKKQKPSEAYYSTCCIPKGISYEYKNFLSFVDARKQLLIDALITAFPVKFEDIVDRYSLDEKIK